MTAVDLAPPLLQQPPGELMIPDGEIYLPGSISGRVFAASARDGALQPSDLGIAGVRVELLAGDGRVLGEALTDADGRYDFPALEPGRYAIRETQPTGYDDGPDWFGDGGGQVEANDFISQIVVMPGADLAGYDFAERLATIEEEVTPPAPIPIPESAHSPLAGFVPLPMIERQRTAELTSPAATAEPVEFASTTLAPLTQRRGERIFASGGRVEEEKPNFDFDAALSDGYDVLAAFFEEFGGPADANAYNEPVASVAADQTTAEEPTDNAARERAFEAADHSPLAEAPGATPTNAPQSARRVDPSHQLVGKPAA